MNATRSPATRAAARRAAAPARFPLTLGVISHVPHWPGGEEGPVAYEPYVREMNLWASLFARVVICAPIAERPPDGNEVPYAARNVEWMAVRYPIVPGGAAHLRRLARVPALVRAFAGLARESELLLLRSPSSFTMWARWIARRRGARTITRWTGPFDHFAGEPAATRIERAQVRRGPGLALVYGRAERPHVIPFFPFAMSDAELLRARFLAGRRRWAPPWKILSVGRLSPEKNFALVLDALGELHRTTDLDWRFTLVGDGIEMERLRALASRRGIMGRVSFVGARPFAEVQELHSESHVVVVPGVREGWPKVLGEAWAHGAFPLVARAGIAPELIERFGVGASFEPTPAALAAALSAALSRPDSMRRASARGPECCLDLTQEKFAERLERVLADDCGLA